MNGPPRILILTPYFEPAQQGGGSVLAVRYLVEQLGAHYEFVVATGERDFGAAAPYADESRADAQRRLGISIHYLSRGMRGLRALWRLLDQPFELIYLNSLLSPWLALRPILIKPFSANRRCPMLIAPRGELKRELMALKPGRKRLYLNLLRALGSFHRAHLHATSQAERTDLEATHLAPVLIAGDLAPTQVPQLPTPGAPQPGPLRIAFVSRIDANKNLGLVLKVLQSVESPVQLDIAGPVGDASYWQQCLQAMQQLPPHVKVRTLGALPHGEVQRLLAEQELFFLPTWSENHGYVILEALLAGCALLISDRTPWRELSTLGVGQDVPLHDETGFVHALNAFIRLTGEERLSIRRRAQRFGQARLQGDTRREAMRALLDKAMARG